MPAHRALARAHRRGRGGAIRHQFHHVNDVMPTIYETLVGSRRPTSTAGVRAAPDLGDVPGLLVRRGRRAEPQARPVLRDDGPPGHLARRVEGGHPPPPRHVLRGRRLGALPPRRGPLRVPQPGRRAPREAGRAGRPVVDRGRGATGVLPLDDRTIELFSTRYRDRSPHPTSRRYSYFPPMSPLPGQVAPALGGRGWDMAATIDRPEGANGVLYASGNENSGVSLFVQDDHLVFDYNCFGDHQVVVSDAPVPVGRSVVGVHFVRTGRGGRADARHRRPAERLAGRAVRHDHDLERGPERRLRPRLAGERALRRPLPLRGDARATRRLGAPGGRRREAEAEVGRTGGHVPPVTCTRPCRRRAPGPVRR